METNSREVFRAERVARDGANELPWGQPLVMHPGGKSAERSAGTQGKGLVPRRRCALFLERSRQGTERNPGSHQEGLQVIKGCRWLSHCFGEHLIFRPAPPMPCTVLLGAPPHFPCSSFIIPCFCILCCSLPRVPPLCEFLGPFKPNSDALRLPPAPSYGSSCPCSMSISPLCSQNSLLRPGEKGC